MFKKKKLLNLETKYFNLWKKNLKKNHCKLINYKKIGEVFRKKENDFIVSLYDTYIKNKTTKVNRYITIVKPSVIIVPIIYFSKEVYTMLVSQIRVYDGKEILEFPAGGIDFGVKPIDAAINELKEELHLSLKKRDIKYLHSSPIMTEPSCTSGASYFFYFKLKVDKKFINKFHLKKTGNKFVGEETKIIIKKINNLYYCNSASIHVGLNLVRKYI
jgi:hypothetical protein